MTDRLKAGSKAWYKRQERHRHNGLIGSAAMIKAHCNQVITARTTHESSKKLAWEIKELAIRLEESLRNNRIDP